jgi:hypothetical protein
MQAKPFVQTSSAHFTVMVGDELIAESPKMNAEEQQSRRENGSAKNGAEEGKSSRKNYP